MIRHGGRCVSGELTNEMFNLQPDFKINGPVDFFPWCLAGELIDTIFAWKLMATKRLYFLLENIPNMSAAFCSYLESKFAVMMTPATSSAA